MKKKIIVISAIALSLIGFVILMILISSPKTPSSTMADTSTTSNVDTHTHTWGEWITEKDATCISQGIKYRICECGEKDEITFSPLGHSFNDWILITDPTCLASGIEERICTECNFNESRTIESLNHTEGDWVISNSEKCLPCIYCGTILRTEELIYSQGLKIDDEILISIGDCTDKDIVVPNSTISIIGKQAFKYEAITSIILPDSIKTIQEKAFYQCTYLEYIHLGANINTIEKRAFYRCYGLYSLQLPNSLETIEEYAFAYCTSLKTVYIEPSVEKFEMGIFQDCKELTDIYFNGTIEEWNAIEKDSRWDVGTAEYTVHCTDGDIEK